MVPVNIILAMNGFDHGESELREETEGEFYWIVLELIPAFMLNLLTFESLRYLEYE